MEGTFEKLDRLNTFLQELVEESPDTSFELLHRVSIATSNPFEQSIDNSPISISDDLEMQIQRILLDLDRSNMIKEDFYSEKIRDIYKISFTKSEIEDLINSLYNLLKGKECIIRLGKETYNLLLNNSECLYDNTDAIENKFNYCGHDIRKITKEIKLSFENEFQEKKKNYMENERINLESQLQEAEKLKRLYLDKLKDLALFNNQLDKKKKIIELQELKMQRTQSNEIITKELEGKINSLKKISDLDGNTEKSRISLKIEQAKNKITNMRVEKCLSESQKTVSVLLRVVKAMEREFSLNEIPRKELVQKYPENTQATKTNGKERRKYRLNSLKKQEENFRDYIESVKVQIKKKEIELNEREKNLSEKGLKNPNNEELIELMKTSLDKMNEHTKNNEHEKEIFEKEKINIINLNEKIMKI